MPRAHVCVTLHDSLVTMISKEPYNLPCAVGILPPGSWAQESLLGSGLHHALPFSVETPSIGPRPSQMPLYFQAWDKHQESGWTGCL